MYDTNMAGMLTNKKYWGVYVIIVFAIMVLGTGYITGAALFEVPPPWLILFQKLKKLSCLPVKSTMVRRSSIIAG